MHFALTLVFCLCFVTFLGIALWWFLRTEEISEDLHITSLTSEVMYGYDFPIEPPRPRSPGHESYAGFWFSPAVSLDDPYDSHRRLAEYGNAMADFHRQVDAYFRNDTHRVPPTKYIIYSSEYPGFSFCFQTWRTFAVGDILPVKIRKRKHSGSIVSFQVKSG